MKNLNNQVVINEEDYKQLTKAEVQLIVLLNEQDRNAGSFYWGNRDSFYINELVRKAVQEDRDNLSSGRITEEEFKSCDPFRYLKETTTVVDIRTGQIRAFRGFEYAQKLQILESKMHPLGVKARLYRAGTFDDKVIYGRVLPGYRRALQEIGFDGSSESIIRKKIAFDNLTSTSYDTKRNHFSDKTNRDFFMYIMASENTLVYIGKYHEKHESEITIGRGQTGTIYKYEEKMDGERKLRYLYIVMDE